MKKELTEDITHMWKINAGQLFTELIDNNSQNWIFTQPFKILYGILQRTAKRAAELKDDKMIGYMCKLGMYEFADPTHKDYNRDACEKYINATKEGQALNIESLKKTKNK